MPANYFQNAPAVFGPADIANLTAAYNEALSSIDEQSVQLDLPSHELRRRLASSIIEEARRGYSNPTLLAERALARLSA